MFWLEKFIAAFVLPPTGLLIVAIAGLLMLRRRPRLGRALAIGAIGALTLLSLPIVASLLTIAVSDVRALRNDEGRDAQAIVVLCGGVRRAAEEYGADAPSTLSLERARYGAWLAKSRGLPLAVSGGVVFGGRPEAEVIGDMLVREFGVPVRWIEPRSRNSRENAQELAALLLPAGVKRVLLVTHGMSMKRQRRELVAAGFEVVPAPTVIQRFVVDGLDDVLPSMSAMRGSYYAIYELLGNLRATLRGLP